MSLFNTFRFKSLLLCAGLLGSLLSFGHGTAFAETTAAASSVQSPPPAALQEPEQRIALVIGNSNYRNAPQLPNPDNDAQSMAQFLNSAGFEVIAATDLTQNDMIKVVQNFSAKVAARGPNTVAMIYYAGHGVQLAGENYLVPVDAKISSAADLVDNSVRLVDVMATLEAIPSRMRIVLLDACRNNPFPTINDAGRGLAIVDAPNGSIVGYSTAPGTEALDGSGGHSPYTAAFLHLAHEPNVPIEQLFKRVRLEVNNSTDGQQTPWESSSLTSDFYFFGDTAVAATRAPARGPMMQTASNLPSRSVRQVYDYVLAEGSPEYYQEFIQLFPHDPLCDRIRWLLGNLLQAQAWHKAVLANTPFAYKTFYDNYSNSPYALSALKLQTQPKLLPLMQPTHLIVPHELAPTLKVTSFGPPKDTLGTLPKPNGEMPLSTPTKIVTLPAPATNATPAANAGSGKIVTLPVTTLGKVNPDLKATNLDLKGTRLDLKANNPPTDRIVALPVTPRQTVRTEVKDLGTLKLNNNPAPTNRFQGKIQGNIQGNVQTNNQPVKINAFNAGNSNPRLAQTMSMGQARKGFH